MIRANVGNGTSGLSKPWARADEMEAQRDARPSSKLYRRPCDRNRFTGSATANACRLKIQRATAKPIAA